MQTNNNFTILIVDDEKLNIELAAIYLQEEGYKLLYATDALSALENISKKKIDLILLDINMPHKDGFEVCTILKDDTKTKDIPVIFLTAQTDIEYISRAFEVGGVDYISKPFNGIELKARVKTHLQNIAYIAEIKNKQSKLALFSITDSLTKLHNSLFFDSQIKNYQNNKENFWIITLKIDRLDKINQIYGFFGANKIIKLFAKLIEKEAFANTKVARLYGARFGILIKNYERELILKLYKEIVLKISKDKNLSKAITFSTILYNVKNNDASIASIYKIIDAKMDNIQTDSEYKYLFI